MGGCAGNGGGGGKTSNRWACNQGKVSGNLGSNDGCPSDNGKSGGGGGGGGGPGGSEGCPANKGGSGGDGRL